MTNQEISHAIATLINGWQHLEGIIYFDPASGYYAYAANYAESSGHAIDLAAANNIAIAFNDGQWQAAKVVNHSQTANSITVEIMPTSVAINPSFPRAICLALLRSIGVEV